MNKLLILFVIFIAFDFCYGQNIILNGDFEDGRIDTGCYCFPGSSFDFINDWESNTKAEVLDIKDKKNCYKKIYYHSPDWFTNDNGLCRNQSYTGCHCVGAREYELFCQKISKSKIIAN